MSNYQLDNSNINVHLGKTSQYKNTYDNTLLVREPRHNNRTYLGIQDSNLPFVGYDTWNAYECSFLLDNGCPVAGVAKICYPASNKYIVESKSIKLYFNSFNMEKMGNNVHDAMLKFTRTVSKDLGEKLETNVNVGFIPGFIYDQSEASAYWVYNKYTYVTLENIIDEKSLIKEPFLIYKETGNILTEHELEVMTDRNGQYFHSGLLKSNCRVTSQPDWGDVYIYINSRYKVNKLSLLKYIVSFRDECHFHEEICECIYKRLYDIFQPDELFVMCLYARRGGIDINPVRASSLNLLNTFCTNLLDVNSPHVKTSKQ